MCVVRNFVVVLSFSSQEKPNCLGSVLGSSRWNPNLWAQVRLAVKKLMTFWLRFGFWQAKHKHSDQGVGSGRHKNEVSGYVPGFPQIWTFQFWPRFGHKMRFGQKNFRFWPMDWPGRNILVF